MNSEIILEKVKSTEKIVKIIEVDNIIVFETSIKARKPQIKEEVEKLFKVKVANVNTHVRRNKKVAYVKLKKGFQAVDIATKLGIM